MKNRMLVSIVFLLLLACAPAVAGAQTARSGQARAEFSFNATARLSNGIYVGFSTRADEPKAASMSYTIETDADNVIHRVLVDQGGGFFYGYDLRVETIPNSKQLKVSIMPLSAEMEQRLRRQSSAATRRPRAEADPPALSPPAQEQVVDDGDSLALDVLVNQQTGGKIADIIKVSSEPISLGFSGLPRPPARDLKLDAVEFSVSNYRLLVNGELVAGANPTGGCSGAIIWFYLPGRGRFIFSIKPHTGYDFQQVGAIENNKILFSVDGEQYQWISSSPIVGASGHFNVWVLHDRHYRPELPDAQGSRSVRYKDRSSVLIGAADAIELVLPRR